MWVWRGLGHDGVQELSSGALGVLGRRCKPAGDEASMDWTLCDSPSRTLSTLRGDAGERLEIHPCIATQKSKQKSRGAKVPGSFRLASMKKLRLCVPSFVELHSTFAKKAEAPTGQRYRSVVDAITKLTEGGGGTFTYRVPTLEACLHQDYAEDIRFSPAPAEWPLCAVGAVLGAEFEIVVTPQRPLDDSQAKGAFRPSTTTMTLKEESVMDDPPVTCDGFSLHVKQRGGPQLDTKRLHMCSKEEVAKELDRWEEAHLWTRPETWDVLQLNTMDGQVKASLTTMVQPDADARCVMMSDVMLAVTADAEISLDPFELTYGEQHLAGLRRILEDEIAHVLGISGDRVLVGEFSHVGRGSAAGGGLLRKRHVRIDSLALRFAILNSDLAVAKKDVRKLLALPKAKSRLFDSDSKSDVRPSTSSGVADAVSLLSMKSIKSAFGKEMSATLRQAGAAMMSIDAMSRRCIGGESRPSAAGKNLKASASAPTLPPLAHASAVPAATPESPGAKSDNTSPDVLLKKLASLLSDSKHPLQRLPDAFPMLSRITGKIKTSATFLIDRNTLPSGALSESLRSFLKAVGEAPESDVLVDPLARDKLKSMRSHALELYEEPDAEAKELREQLLSLSAMQLLDYMESTLSKRADLQAVLLAMCGHCEDDVEWCLRLNLHHGLERLIWLCRRFNSDKWVVTKSIEIISHMTGHDPGSVDCIFEKDLVEGVIVTLDNFPKEHELQSPGCKILRRVYLRARELASHGPRIVLLGHSLEEIWTFKGLERIFQSMRLFGSDAELQLECLTLLATLGEMLFNTGMASETFGVLQVVMATHAEKVELLTKCVVIISKFGPAFFQFEHRGIRSVVDIMARHRSNVELQRSGMRLLLSMAKDEKALIVCKTGGAVGMVVAAMAAHSKDEQVVRDGVRALERLCPRGLAKVFRICGDVATVLPPVVWSERSSGGRWDAPIDEGQWSPRLVKRFRQDMGSVYEKSYGLGDDEDDDATDAVDPALLAAGGLGTLPIYRRRGLREEFDASDSKWATSLANRHKNKARERDIGKLREQGTDAASLRMPGPSSDHINSLCAALRDGLAQNYGAQDCELIAALLAHFSWASGGHAKDVVGGGGPRACLSWMACERITKARHPEEVAMSYSMKRACLNLLSSICQCEEDLATQVLNLGAAAVAKEHAQHPDSIIQRSAMRLLARLIRCESGKAIIKQVPRADVWHLVQRDLCDDSEIVRTCSAACALETAEAGWAASEEAPMMNVSPKLLASLDRSVQQQSPSASLPLLLTVGRLLSETDGNAAKSLLHSQDKKTGQSLLQLLAFWMRRGVASGASVADKGAAAAAASALLSLAEFEAPFPFKESRELLLSGQSKSADAMFRDSCKSALLASIDKETQPQQLALIFAIPVAGKGDGQTQLADLEILRPIAGRIVHLLRSGGGHATDLLIEALSHSMSWIPKEPKDEANAVHLLINEALTFGKNISDRGLAPVATIPGDGDALLDNAGANPQMTMTQQVGGGSGNHPGSSKMAMSSPPALLGAAISAARA